MALEEFVIRVDDDRLHGLHARLAATEWAPELENDDWRFGTNGAYLRELVDYWRNGYDWREREARLNAHRHFRVTIDQVPIHFMHVPGQGPNPFPLVVTHGWPWTFWDYRKVIGPLADPASHGGDPADAFDLVVPSLPGFGFSTPLTRSGINFWRTAELWLQLMRDVLGHRRFGAVGGDLGAFVSEQLGHSAAEHVAGIHLSNVVPLDMWSGETPWMFPSRHAASHVAVHVLDPQTLGWAGHDSPVGTLAWLLERRRAWSDCGGDVERRFSKDDLLDNAMIYWAGNSFVNTLRFYAEATYHPWQPSHDRSPVVEVPTGVTFLGPRAQGLDRLEWVEQYFNLHSTNEHPRGGHFAPMEEPEALVRDIRRTFRDLR
jgi:pimeloyl-ACP methyl ester carboxylesterase